MVTEKLNEPAKATHAQSLVLQLSALLMPEDGGYVVLCPELDVASEGDTEKDALAMLHEAIELTLEAAHPTEIVKWLTCDMTEMLVACNALALKAQVEKSRRVALGAVEVLLGQFSPNGTQDLQSANINPKIALCPIAIDTPANSADNG